MATRTLLGLLALCVLLMSGCKQTPYKSDYGGSSRETMEDMAIEPSERAPGVNPVDTDSTGEFSEGVEED